MRIYKLTLNYRLEQGEEGDLKPGIEVDVDFMDGVPAELTQACIDSMPSVLRRAADDMQAQLDAASLKVTER